MACHCPAFPGARCPGLPGHRHLSGLSGRHCSCVPSSECHRCTVCPMGTTGPRGVASRARDAALGRRCDGGAGQRGHPACVCPPLSGTQGPRRPMRWGETVCTWTPQGRWAAPGNRSLSGVGSSPLCGQVSNGVGADLPQACRLHGFRGSLRFPSRHSGTRWGLSGHHPSLPASQSEHVSSFQRTDRLGVVSPVPRKQARAMVICTLGSRKEGRRRWPMGAEPGLGLSLPGEGRGALAGPGG